LVTRKPRGFHEQAPKSLSISAPERAPAFRGSPRGTLERAVRVDLIPRHGFPHPLRSAYVVSHDLGGLPFSRSVRHFSSGHVPGVWGTVWVSRRIVRAPRGPKTV
jgi:hypothetical protein